MTICAQQFDVISVGLPISEASRPNIMSVLWSELRCRINVVDIERAEVVKAAAHTFAAEFRDEFKLPRPIATALVRLVALAVPISSLAVWRTEPCAGARSALDARAFVAPSRGKITRLTTIFSRAVFQSVGVHLRGLAAVCAGYRHPLGAFLSHSQNITLCGANIYFDIACRRIEEATRQGDLIRDVLPPKPEQKGLAL
jgi:hypothetical protein